MAGVREIARAAGVSTATVSRSLADSSAVSAALKQKVRSAAAALNYRPETARRGRPARHAPGSLPHPGPASGAAHGGSAASGSVLLFIPHTHATALHNRSIGYFAYVFSGIVRRLEEAGLSLNLTPYPTGQLGTLLQHAHLARQQRQGARGLLLLFSSREEDRLLRRAVLPLPWIALNRVVPGAELTVRCDERRGAREAAALLLAHGHRRIGVLAGPARFQFFEERLAGVREALWAAGLPLPAERIARAELSREAGRSSARKLLDLRPRPTALFATEEDFAAAALQEAEARGLRVPADLSLAAFSDFVLSAQPGQGGKAVTAVSVPAFEMGYLAVDTLVNRGRIAVPLRAELVLRPTLVERQSVARIAPHPSSPQRHSGRSAGVSPASQR